VKKSNWLSKNKYRILRISFCKNPPQLVMPKKELQNILTPYSLISPQLKMSNSNMIISNLSLPNWLVGQYIVSFIISEDNALNNNMIIPNPHPLKANICPTNHSSKLQNSKNNLHLCLNLEIFSKELIHPPPLKNLWRKVGFL